MKTNISLILLLIITIFISNAYTADLDNNCYTPINNILKSHNDITTDQTIVNSSNYITTNQELSKRFKDNNIGIENMEYFALMHVAAKFNIPIAGIFIVTNYTNTDAHKDFISNHKEAMTKLVDYLKMNNIIT